MAGFHQRSACEIGLLRGQSDDHSNPETTIPRCTLQSRPLFVDPSDGPGAIVHDHDQVFVKSANLTPNALDRNIEAGVLVRDRALA